MNSNAISTECIVCMYLKIHYAKLIAEIWKNRFYIVFEDEELQDAGDLLRKWYKIVSRVIFNPNYVLFTV